ncbi:hypothetical protein DEB41_17305 [Vibrio anguillarum]|uniref:Uncharacterized protein n=4 Tax=Vibrio anguillarum TaxID=55601 RepID=A0AAW4B7L4_VIBAN|nr:hypothetical protein [Vibrio anguillarum]AGU59908.1 hypothetical protein N175_18850 [Vibrio anguillarum M3]AQP38048.1 hypothetical protein AA909_17015 [Vibrio anguillarum]ASF93657.1 hypothetical protein CEA93_16645 [Vibrio anguillarum]ATA51290.1 hypothetical protein CLI14_16585 [Vibrio anguillarum]AVT65830.1 hypothetical protein B5S57_01100 [Vibrio anguillarum]
MKIHRSLLVAVEQSAGENVLRDICLSLLNTGVPADSILDEFEELRATHTLDGEYEDTLLDVMDALCGWCSPNHALVPTVA